MMPLNKIKYAIRPCESTTLPYKSVIEGVPEFILEDVVVLSQRMWSVSFTLSTLKPSRFSILLGNSHYRFKVTIEYEFPLLYKTKRFFTLSSLKEFLNTVYSS